MELAPDGGGERIGELVDDRYRIQDVLGRGGMGTVYRAEQVTLHRSVALKLLHPALGGSTDMARRFEREAFAAGRLVHPNCVQVTDFGQLADGTLYLAMELLEGRSLGDLLDQERRVALPRALHIIAHVLRGLAHAHERDIVHRDIKPENVILVERDGDPDFAKVLDFGIAKLVGGTEAQAGGKLTQAGVTFGTPTYMSPEQAWGQSVDGRADLYAVSVLLFELIAGRPPFEADEPVKLLSMHATRPPPRLSEVAPELAIPPSVEALLARGLAKDRESRPDSALAYLGEVEGLLAELSAPPPPPASPEHQVNELIGRADTAFSQPLPASTPVPGSLPAAPANYTGPSGYLIQAPRNWRRVAGIAGTLFGLLVLFAALAAGSGEDTSREKRLRTAIDTLQNGSSCAERKQAVAPLRRLNDKRAIPPLEKARYRMRGGIAGIGAKNSNSCLRKDAEEAIQYLRTLD
jgi:eukaryotic-like serine/threonine-protein kinase